MSVDGVYYLDKSICNLVCLGVVSNVLDSCLVRLNVIPATRTRRYGRDGPMVQVLGAQKLSVLELNEIELANGVESDVRVGHHVSVLWCGIVVDCCEDRLCHVPHCCSGWGHLAVDGDAVEICCCSDPISCY